MLFILCFFLPLKLLETELKLLVKKLQCEHLFLLLFLFLPEYRSSFSTKSNTDSLALKPCPFSLLLLSPSFLSLFFTHNSSSLHSGMYCPSLWSFLMPSLQPGPRLIWNTSENWDGVSSSSLFILLTHLLLLKRQKNRKKPQWAELRWVCFSSVDQKTKLHRVSSCPGSV